MTALPTRINRQILTDISKHNQCISPELSIAAFIPMISIRIRLQKRLGKAVSRNKCQSSFSRHFNRCFEKCGLKCAFFVYLESRQYIELHTRTKRPATTLWYGVNMLGYNTVLLRVHILALACVCVYNT